MLYKKNKISIIILIVFLLMNFSLFSQSEGDSSDLYDPVDHLDDPVYEDPTDPAASLPQPQITDPTSEPRYTDLEFSNLPDEEKKNIYFNFPHLLPENFDPDVYMHIFHPQPEDTE